MVCELNFPPVLFISGERTAPGLGIKIGITIFDDRLTGMVTEQTALIAIAET
jgi:hypothetical protein